MAEPNLLDPFAQTTDGDPLKGVGDALPKFYGMLGGGAGLLGLSKLAAPLGALAFGLEVGNAAAPYVFEPEPSGTKYEEVPPDGEFKPTSGNKYFDRILEGGMSAFDYLGL